MLKGEPREQSERGIVDSIRRACKEVPEIAEDFENVYEHGFEESCDYDRLRDVLREGLELRIYNNEADFDWM